MIEVIAVGMITWLITQMICIFFIPENTKQMEITDYD